MTPKQLLDLTYSYSGENLLEIVDDRLIQLPGGEDWKEGKR